MAILSALGSGRRFALTTRAMVGALLAGAVGVCASCSLALDTNALQGGSVTDAGIDAASDAATTDDAAADSGGPTCGGGATGDRCVACLEQKCCSQLRACYGEPVCAKGFADFAKCERESPKPACAEKLPTGLIERALLSCAATSCATTCPVGALP